MGFAKLNMSSEPWKEEIFVGIKVYVIMVYIGNNSMFVKFPYACGKKLAFSWARLF